VLSFVLSAVASLKGGRDTELIGRIARGDRGALELVYQRASGRAMAIAQRVLGTRNEAEEIVQEVFLEVWRRASRFDPTRGRLDTWINVMTRTRSIDRLRRRAIEARVVGQAEEPMPERTPLETAEQRLDRARIREALAAIPREQRATVELSYFEGLSLSEIAERTGDPLGTIKSRMRAALDKLSALLADRGTAT
jgi:RNA polymerase sigma-70 factor (ECF subfamily)